MIDHDLSRELHSLASTVDESPDLVALHRRISAHDRRRTIAKVGFAGAGLAALVGGLIFVRDDRSSPAASSSTPAAAAPPPPCDDITAQMRALKTTTPAVTPKTVPTGTGPGIDDVSGLGFKGIVTILTIDGSQLTFRSDEPAETPPTTRAGLLDDATDWVDGDTHLDAPSTLQVGDHVGLATARTADGSDHVILIDIGTADLPASDRDPSVTKDPTTVDAVTLPSAATEKGLGTITTVDATSLTVTLDDATGQTRTFAIDPTVTPFLAGDTACTPGALTVGDELGVAFHFDDAGNVVGDIVMLLP